MLITRAFLYITFSVPSKEPLLQAPFREPIERDAPFSDPSLNYPSEFPGGRVTSKIHLSFKVPSK
jgi:hypothetical protein